MIGGIYRQLEVRNMQVDHRETGEAPRTRSVACNVIRGSLGNLIEWYDWYAYAASASTSQAYSSHRESDSAAVEHRWHLRGRLPRLAARRLDVRSVCRPIWAAPGVRQSLTWLSLIPLSPLPFRSAPLTRCSHAELSLHLSLSIAPQPLSRSLRIATAHPRAETYLATVEDTSW